ncbi:MAG: 2-oxoacid:acceptor oxidoreductase subunit alpha [Anaerolineales bacterium]|nr:2-oxoacid:acceptor oxidoreductase subunit alpha [Anaerolineales bacterium]MCB0017163.1 2-oxoacid:acceptor oxidoreductase subunit alpha [Anaerolineales bacterium]MCB8963335.1 2-oxoacid:acceptor oxidoreductase subunit alpha [Ardenticatenales bacterium]
MSVMADVAPSGELNDDRPPIVNDFSLVVATANGTGSQTSNMAILRACFKMGIPVNGKNIFPSNIQGLPTWYHIRLSKDGYIARRHTSELLVAFNEVTAEADIAELPAGGVCIYNADWRSVPERSDVIFYGLPVRQFVRDTDTRGKLRDYISNMVYVGGISWLLGIPLEAIDEALDNHFGSRRKLVDSNMAVVREAYEWASENWTKRDPYRVEPMDATAGKIIMTGNEAAALGAVFGGMTFCAWYPITPSTSLVDALNYYLPQMRRDEETGTNSYAVVQAEDELAAIGMVLGAGWAGARAMTATSGPGVSLMAEFAGLAYFAEIPSVIWDIQRVGPSTGLPTRTGQGDIIFSYYLGHGDTNNVLLFPASIAECFEFGTTALNLADQLQTLVLVLSDLDLGMNNWMSDPFEYPTEPINRGKVLTAEEVEAKGFARYRDLDGDGVGYRTLPGNEHPKSVYFTRGTGHNADAVYSERGDDWLDNMDRLRRKFETARNLVPGPVVDNRGTTNVGIISLGTTQYAIEEALDRLEANDMRPDFMRLRALPINDEVKQFIADHDRVYVIEMNRDGQLHKILQVEVPEMATKLHSIAFMDGMPLTARWLVETFEAAEEKNG